MLAYAAGGQQVLLDELLELRVQEVGAVFVLLHLVDRLDAEGRQAREDRW